MSATTGATSKQIANAYEGSIEAIKGFITDANKRGVFTEVEALLIVHTVCNALVMDHLIIPRAYLDALEALVDAGSSSGVADGRWAREGLWQDAEIARDAAREEMGE